MAWYERVFRALGGLVCGVIGLGIALPMGEYATRTV